MTTTEMTDSSPAGIKEASTWENDGHRSVEGEAFDQSKMVVPLDGFLWRKYGQKFIKSIGKNRSYFKCQNEKCKVKKRVEWSSSSDPPNNLRVVYDGVHNHGSPSSSSVFKADHQESASTNQYNLFTQVFGAADDHQESASNRHAPFEK